MRLGRFLDKLFDLLVEIQLVRNELREILQELRELRREVRR